MDGIQSATGCTLGKGNLIFKDYGKHVYTFLRRSDGKAVRIVVRPEYWSERTDEHEALWAKLRAGTIASDERARFLMLQEERARQILETPEAHLLEIQPAELQPPRKVRQANYMLCDRCGELTLESHTRRLGGQTLCIPCFEGMGS